MEKIKKIAEAEQTRKYIQFRYEGSPEYIICNDGRKEKRWDEEIRAGYFWDFIYKEEDKDEEAGKYVEYEDMKINYVWNHGAVGLKVHYNKNDDIFKVTK